MSRCSRYSIVRLWSARCRSCTNAFHVPPVYSLLQSSHCRHCSLNSTVRRCRSVAPLSTSPCTLIQNLSRRLCGSVQTQPASLSCTLPRPPWRRLPPPTRRRQSVSSSPDSRSARTHWCVAVSQRPHFLQQLTLPVRGMPSVMSYSCATHAAHMATGFGGMATPQRQHRIVPAAGVAPIAPSSAAMLLRVRGAKAQGFRPKGSGLRVQALGFRP